MDRTTGILYLYPIAPLDQSLVQFPILEQPFLRLDGVQHVTLRGLTFELGRAEGAVVSDGEGVLLAGCTFRQLGSNGVIIQGGRGHGLLGCDLTTLGGGGVRVAGGDRASLTASEHFVETVPGRVPCQLAGRSCRGGRVTYFSLIKGLRGRAGNDRVQGLPERLRP